MKTLLWLTAGVGLGLAGYMILNMPGPRYATGSEDVEDTARSVTGWGTKQTVKGATGNLLGRVKERVGNFAGDNDLADQGVGDQVAGAARKTAGKFAKAAGQTLHDLNR
jgi:uncharacterized protein YjbJ (UPF0337 family)